MSNSKNALSSSIRNVGTVRQITIVLLLLPFFPSPVSANQDNHMISVYVLGIGDSSCGDFIQDIKSARPTQGINTEHGLMVAKSSSYIHWASGYITSLNIWRAVQTPPVKQFEHSQATIASWLENYCKDNALERFDSAVRKMLASDGAK